MKRMYCRPQSTLCAIEPAQVLAASGYNVNSNLGLQLGSAADPVTAW